jgi:two-component system, chemotaxis family, response regulator WspF
MRIAIVNDQPLAVEVMRRTLGRAPEHSIAWVARDGAEAVRQCAADTPDLVLMDLFMPVMDGVEATRRIMRQSPCAILVVTGNVSDSVSKVFEAMGAGALDAISTPIVDEGESAPSPLLKKIRLMQKLIAPGSVGTAAAAAKLVPGAGRGPLIAIGASTGGPAVLTTLLSALPGDFAAAVIVVQHVDVQFAGEMARWLGQSSRIPVRVARPGDVPTPGEALLAATNDHLALTARRQLEYRPEPVDYPYRPSVNVFFDSLVRFWPQPGLAILLTGMGNDGASGLLKLREAGWRTIAQDRESCAVYGMPKAAHELGAAGQILAPVRIGQAMLEMAAPPRRPAGGPGS